MSSDEPDPRVAEGLTLLRAFMKISDASGRRKVIDLTIALAKRKPPASFAAKLIHWCNGFSVVMLGLIGVQTLARHQGRNRDDD
jgi:hypothetical protein